MLLKPSKTIVIGDLHLDKNNLDVAEKFFDFLDSRLSEEEAEFSNIRLVFLGDNYHTKAIIRSEAQNFLIENLQSILKKHKTVDKIYIIVGNHDYNNMSCEEHALTPLKTIDLNRLIVVDHPIEDKEFLLLPYYNSKEQFIKVLKDHLSSACKYVFCHQGVEGFDYGNGILDRDGVSVKDLVNHNVDFIIGHYHKQQKVGNIFYLGTPFSHSFGEANQLKGILEITNDKQEFLITNEFIPCHYKLKFSDDGFDKPSKQVLKYISEDDFVECQISCTKEFAKNFSKEKFIESALKVDIKNLRLKFNIIDSNKSVRLDENQSMEVIFQKYLEQNKLDHLYDLGMMFLKNANIQV